MSIGLLIVVLLVGGCGGETRLLPESPEIMTTGSLTGFVSPIDIRRVDAVLFDGTREVARATYSDGVFNIEAVPAGTYRLEVRAFGYQLNDAATAIRIRPGELVDVGRVIMIGIADDMNDTPYVEGVVLDATTGAPLKDADIRVTCPYGVCSVQYATTDERGAFRAPVPVGFEALAVADAPNYVGKGVFVEPVERGETTQVIFRLIRRMP
jgi:hypothetical protein